MGLMTGLFFLRAVVVFAFVLVFFDKDQAHTTGPLEQRWGRGATGFFIFCLHDRKKPFFLNWPSIKIYWRPHKFYELLLKLTGPSKFLDLPQVLNSRQKWCPFAHKAQNHCYFCNCLLAVVHLKKRVGSKDVVWTHHVSRGSNTKNSAMI